MEKTKKEDKNKELIGLIAKRYGKTLKIDDDFYEESGVSDFVDEILLCLLASIEKTQIEKLSEKEIKKCSEKWLGDIK